MKDSEMHGRMKVTCHRKQVRKYSVDAASGLGPSTDKQAWFDIESWENLEEAEETDIAGLQRFAQLVYRHIKCKIRFGISSDKFITGGLLPGGDSGAVLSHALPQATGWLCGLLHCLGLEE